MVKLVTLITWRNNVFLVLKKIPTPLRVRTSMRSSRGTSEYDEFSLHHHPLLLYLDALLDPEQWLIKKDISDFRRSRYNICMAEEASVCSDLHTIWDDTFLPTPPPPNEQLMTAAVMLGLFLRLWKEHILMFVCPCFPCESPNEIFFCLSSAQHSG